ncbi:MAG: oligosaccharide flippase family protein [Candidatus Methanomethylicia archaeon]
MSNKLVEIAEDSARGGFFLFTGNALSLITLAIGSIIVARLLGPENYGLLSLSLVVPYIFAGLIDFGISSALTRFSAKFRVEGKNGLVVSVLKSGLLFKLLIGIFMSIICLVFSDMFAAYILNRPEIGFLIRIASFLILFQSFFTALNSSFVGLDRMEGSALIMNIQSIMRTTLSPLLVVLGFSVVGALTGHILSYTIATLVGSLILLKYYRGLGSPSNNSFKYNIKLMVGYGFPLYLSALLDLFLGQYRTIILAYFTSNFEIGNFIIATNLSSLINVLVFPLGVLFPVFSKVNPNGDELKRVFRLSVKYTALLIIPAAIIIAILSRDVVYTLYGCSYNLAPLFLSLYILQFLYAGFGSIVLGYLFSGIGETRIILKSNLINLSIFIPLAPLLTMLYSVSGLILALLTSSLPSLSYAVFIAIKRINVNFDLKASLRIYLASFLSAIPIVVLLQFSPLNSLLNLIIASSIFLITYITLIPLIGAINKSDLDNFKLMFGRLKIVWSIVKLVLIYEGRILNLRLR